MDHWIFCAVASATITSSGSALGRTAGVFSGARPSVMVMRDSYRGS
jgi:hypothetical protein